jgi:hypothetical protein
MLTEISARAVRVSRHVDAEDGAPIRGRVAFEEWLISRAGTNAAARADRDLRKTPSRIASPSTNGPRQSTPEPRAATGRVTSSFVSVHGQCSFSMSANRA